MATKKKGKVKPINVSNLEWHAEVKYVSKKVRFSMPTLLEIGWECLKQRDPQVFEAVEEYKKLLKSNKK